MSSSYRRFEILLPLQFNDGQPVPGDLVTKAILELEQHFGAVSCEPRVQGLWRHQGQIYRDSLMRVFVDALDTAESRHFFVGFKERAKSMFQQIDIWMTTYPIEVL